MKQNHPLAFILRKRKMNESDIDSAFDLICATNFFAGQFNNDIPVEDSREAFEALKKFIRSTPNQ